MIEREPMQLRYSPGEHVADEEFAPPPPAARPAGPEPAMTLLYRTDERVEVWSHHGHRWMPGTVTGYGSSGQMMAVHLDDPWGYTIRIRAELNGVRPMPEDTAPAGRDRVEEAAKAMAQADGYRWPGEPTRGAFPAPLAVPGWWMRMAALALATPLPGPWHPVDPENPPDECPRGCGCRWREDADRQECGCDGPCTGLGGGDDGLSPDAAWEARPDPGDEPPRIERDAPLHLGKVAHTAGEGVTVGALRQALELVPDHTVVILQSDGEGNGFSPLVDAEESLYARETSWSGEVYPRDGAADPEEYGEAPDGAYPVVVLVPTN